MILIFRKHQDDRESNNSNAASGAQDKDETEKAATEKTKKGLNNAMMMKEWNKIMKARTCYLVKSEGGIYSFDTVAFFVSYSKQLICSIVQNSKRLRNKTMLPRETVQWWFFVHLHMDQVLFFVPHATSLSVFILFDEAKITKYIALVDCVDHFVCCLCTCLFLLGGTPSG